MKLVLDQGCPWSLAGLLNKQGWDVVHVSDLKMSMASDTAILEWARKNDRICITHDADFHSLIAIQEAVSPSTIRIRIRIRIEGLKADDLAKLLIREWSKIAEPLKKGALVAITEHNVRIHELPIQ